jgi:large subunit ribosomal protein L13
MRTYSLKTKEIKRQWHLLDAKDAPLGRLATAVASLLLGKQKPRQTPHIDNGDYVIVINSDNLKVTGKKTLDKIYRRHSGYPGGLHQKQLRDVVAKDSTVIIRRAVRGMLPDNKLRQSRLARLKIYPDAEHPHSGQNPQSFKAVGNDSR